MARWDVGTAELVDELSSHMEAIEGMERINENEIRQINNRFRSFIHKVGTSNIELV